MRLSKAVLAPLLLLLLFLVLNVIALTFYLDELRTIIRRRIDHLSWSVPTTIYSAPFMLYPNQRIDQSDLTGRLQRLGYRAVHTNNPRPGEVSLLKNMIKIHTKPSLMPAGERGSQRVTLLLTDSGETISRITLEAQDGNEEKPFYELEPEIIGYLFSDTIEKRQVIRLDELPPQLWKTVVAIEDSRFWSHTGIDIRGIARALYHDIRTGNLAQGGSTLTQQLVKNFFLTKQRKLGRKVNEALMSLIMEREYSKDRILEAYLNEIYFGQDGSYPIHGVQEAAAFYFSKNIADLDVPEIAMLVALIRGPGVYSPLLQPENARNRRTLVLKKMLEESIITQEEHDAALESPLPRSARSRYHKRTAPYFVDYVVSELIHLFDQRSLSGQGLHVFTTLDPLLQSRATRIFQQSLGKLSKKIEGAFLLMDHHNGDILALSGGHDYAETQYNRAIQAKRQVGSLFKPLVFLQALIDSSHKKLSFHEFSPLSDQPFTWEYEKQSWSPKNYDDTFHEDVTFGDALAKSYNVATARLGSVVGLEPIIQLAISLGFEGPIPVVPSIVLGSLASSMLEVATAYGTIANMGFQYKPTPVRTVFGQNKELLFQFETLPKPAAPSDATYYLRHLMKNVFKSGTGRAYQSARWSNDYGGKTGTTSDEHDAWFAGFDDRWTLITWIGSDTPESIHLTGATGALPIWAAMIEGINGLRPKGNTPSLPEELSWGTVDAGHKCRSRKAVLYFKNAPPDDLCSP